MRKAVFISAIIEDDVIRNPKFIKNAQKMDSILIIHGEQDDRVFMQGIYNAEKFFRENNIPVTVLYYPKSDHFLLFEKEDEVLTHIKAFLTTSSLN